MAYSETGTNRIRDMFDGNPAVREQKIFGELTFMINGNMSVGVLDDRLILRLGEERTPKPLKMNMRSSSTSQENRRRPLSTFHPTEFAGKGVRVVL